MTRARAGQHFLTDRNLLQKIVSGLDPNPNDVVLEIGAGRGALTDVVAPHVFRVIAVEADRRLAFELGARNAERGTSNVRVVEGDALKLDWHSMLDSSAEVPRFKILGNIPYYITSPLIEKALTPPLPSRIVFLVQREVAERLAATPGSRAYGALSVGVQAMAQVEQLFVISAGAFQPPPRVDSMVVRITPRADPLVAPEDVPAFRAFVTACFSQRRKQLRNTVAAALGRPASVAGTLLGGLGLDPTARPETLAPVQFARLLRAGSGL
ncbi:MAG TPA: 16S rRNA (adenine(1518)-N(6)/adenine(1519)-N(6))-dimethyltransferase RsmA [Gemmatimonadales bacterium]|nr:16S rRNA (adenine(1518)-N(6)/adenine(1519)-N(6))-dimethyltransferase RsmA [Gemmatimonadales bacterium]